MAKWKSIYWQAPTTVLLALISGALFAIGHHLFYSSLDGQSVPNDNYSLLGSDVSAQQINIAGGTALAFLVKACLITAIGTAYAQIFWRAMLHRAPTLTLDKLDTTFSAISNVHHLFKVWIWRRYPLLFSFALIAWTIPLASIVTPATLSIKSAPVVPPPHKLRQVPNLDFVNLNYINYMSQGGYSYAQEQPNMPVQFFYNGPNKAVTNVARAAAVEGSILPLRGPGLNSSYTLVFSGPSLRCSGMPSRLRSSVEVNIAEAVLPSNGSCKAYGFLGWTPAANASQSGILSPPVPFTRISNTSFTLNAAARSNRAGPAPASLYIAAMPNIMRTTSIGGAHLVTSACQPGTLDTYRDELFANSTMLQCDLHNSTYNIHFSFVNGEQLISVETTQFDTNIMTTLYDVFGPPSHPSPGRKTSGSGCSPLNEESADKCLFDASVVRTLAYQAIMEAFNQLIVGSVYIVNQGIGAIFDSNVHDTILAGSPELAFLDQQVTSGTTGFDRTLQQNVLASNGSLFNGILNNQSSVFKQPLASALEQLFQNITISMMSSKKLQPDYSSAFAPPLVNVTFHTYHNIYTYSAYKLWIAYGLAIFFASLCALIGLITIDLSEASYSLSFSTVLRASRSAYTDVELKQSDSDISDPLPRHLLKARLWLGKPPAGSDVSGSKVTRGDEAANVVEQAPMLATAEYQQQQHVAGSGPPS